MIVYLTVCIGIATAAFVVLVVFAVRTAIQVRMTARSLECLSEKLNAEIDRIRQAADIVSNLTGAVGGFMGGSIGALVNLAFRVVRVFQDHKGSAKTEKA